RLSSVPQSQAAHRHLHSFPTRRSSDLPFAGSAKNIRANKEVADGVHTEIKEFVSGYVVVKADTIDEAVEMAKGNPIFEQVGGNRSEEHTSELQSRENLVCRLLLEKKKA